MTDLDAIEKRAREARERAEKATAGPCGYLPDGESTRWRCVGPSVPSMIQAEIDCAFIASARTDVPLLADDVLALVEEVRLARALYEEVEDIVSCSDPFMGPPMKSCGDCEHCRVAIAREAYRALLAKREAP